MKNRNIYFWVIWIAVTAVSFSLFFFEVGYVLGSSITLQNMIAYLVLSLVFGVVSSTLYLLNLRIVHWFFWAAQAAGKIWWD